MRLSRETIVNLLALAFIAGAAAWFVSRTEWVDVWVPTPPKGEAAKDNLFAAKQLLRQLGATVVAPENLDRLPPPGATLVLFSQQWNLFPERDAQLKRWVEGGGQLVLPNFRSDVETIAWIPIYVQPRQRSNDAAPGPAAAASAAERRRAADREKFGPHDGPDQACPVHAEPSSMPGAFGAPRSYRLCGVAAAPNFEPLVTTQKIQWSVNDPRGPSLLRVAFGRGSVTGLAANGLFGNRNLFSGDHALAVVAALRPSAGREIWFVVAETRAALALWLWQRAAPAIGLAIAALAFALWRGALRFGPLASQASPSRRSVAEQIRGSAAFVLRRGGAPLLAAALRALDESARKRLPGLDRMGLADRAAAIGQALSLIHI